MLKKRTAGRPSASAAASPATKTVAKGKMVTKVNDKTEETDLAAGLISGPMGEVGAASSVTRRVSGSDDVFVSVSVKWPFEATEEGFEEAKEKVTELVDAWLTERIENLPTGEIEEEVEGEVEEGTETEEAEGEGEEEELTEEAVMAMDADELAEVMKEYGVTGIKKGLKLPALRKAVVEALFVEEEAETEGEEETETEEAGDEAEEETQDPYTEEELGEMQLKDLQEIAEAWELKVTTKKGADLKAKKAAYIKAILAEQG